MSTTTSTPAPTRPALAISPKVATATVAAALVTVAVWALETYAGVSLPTAVQGAVTTLLVFAGGYLPRG